VCPPDESVATPVPPQMKTPEPPLGGGYDHGIRYHDTVGRAVARSLMAYTYHTDCNIGRYTVYNRCWNRTSLCIYVYRVPHKNNPTKTYISRERHDLNYSNLQHYLLPRDSTWDSENFIHIVSGKNRSYSCISWKLRFYSWTLVTAATAVP